MQNEDGYNQIVYFQNDICYECFQNDKYASFVKGIITYVPEADHFGYLR